MYCFKPEMCFNLRSSNCIKFPATSSWLPIAKPCLRRYCNNSNVVINICLWSSWSLCWLSSCASTFGCLWKSNFITASLWRLNFVCCSTRSRAFFQLSNPAVIYAGSPYLSFRRPCLMQYRQLAQYAFQLLVHSTSHGRFLNQSAQNCWPWPGTFLVFFRMLSSVTWYTCGLWHYVNNGACSRPFFYLRIIAYISCKLCSIDVRRVPEERTTSALYLYVWYVLMAPCLTEQCCH